MVHEKLLLAEWMENLPFSCGANETVLHGSNLIVISLGITFLFLLVTRLYTLKFLNVSYILIPLQVL